MTTSVNKLLAELLAWVIAERSPRWRLIFHAVAAILTALVVIGIDLVSPTYVNYGTLYIGWTAAVSWFFGWRWGLVAAASALTYRAAEDSAANTLGEVLITIALLAPAYLTGVLVANRLAHDRIQLRNLARTDPLTGLANRRHFEIVVAEELTRAWRYHWPVCIAVLDANGFKIFNDTNGHVAGDNALRRIAAVLRSGLRTTDTVARVGGDEFSVLFPQTTEAAAHVALTHVMPLLVEVYGPGLSVGVTEHHPQPPNLEKLLQDSDVKMYRYKRGSYDNDRRNQPENDAQASE